MNKVAILYIATDKYIVFWEDFYKSYEKYFLNNSEIHYYVFTDAEDILFQDDDRVHVKKIKHMEWPYGTLMRYHIFLNIESELEQYDYLCFMNANCICVSPISEKDFLPKEKDLVVVKHFKYYDSNNIDFSYDRNPKSKAFIPYGEGKYYVCGGINGGKTRAYLDMCKELRDRIDLDLSNGVIALYHDESQLNRYILDNDNYIILSPEYVYPQGFDLPFDSKIVTRDKTKYFNVDRFRSVKSRASKKDIIVVKIKGELGERLFQYAFAKQLQFMGKKVYIDSEYIEEFDVGIPIASYKDIKNSKKESTFIKHLIKVVFKIPQRQVVFDEKDGVEPYIWFFNNRGYYCGQWKSEQFFSGIRKMVLDEFRHKIKSIVDLEKDRYLVTEDAISYWQAFLRINRDAPVEIICKNIKKGGEYQFESLEWR